uniref:Uncharacterized protein n=1 Tax=viral metagenome TaxID=1070528 RepID=A0A6C0LJL0_9ZZZZ
MEEYLLIIIIVLLIYLISKTKSNYCSYCLLLTTTVNKSKERLEQYQKSIDSWLDKSNLDLFIVESSNFVFDKYKNNKRVHQFSFKPTIKTNRPDLISTGQLESESILKAVDHFKEKMKNYNTIIKLTGKYFIPNFEKITKKLPLSDLYIQKRDTWEKCVASEIFGFKKSLTKNIFTDLAHTIRENKEAPNGYENIEFYLRRFVNEHPNYKVYQFPTLKLGWSIYRCGAEDFVVKL